MWSVFLYFLFYLTQVHSAEGPTYSERCHETHGIGLETLIRTAISLASEETTNIQEKFAKAMDHANGVLGKRSKRSVELDGDTAAPTPTPTDWNPLCPRPNASMFTTAPPPTMGPTTTPMSTTVQSTTGGAQTTGAGTTTGTPTTTLPPFEDPQKGGSSGQAFRAVPLYMDHEDDPLAVHMNRFHKYISKPEHSCNAEFTDLNSITEHQLFGFVSSLATTNVGPFCSVCHRMVDEVRKRAFVISTVMHSENHQIMGKFFHSHVPSTKAICSAIAPACYDNYEEKVVNITSALICAECSLCMTATNILQHRVLLKQDVVLSIYNFLRSSLFHNICAELCNNLAGQDWTMFPNGFGYDSCQNFFQTEYYAAVRFISTITRPERFCSLELGWCELNEVPNMLQCLPELCEDLLSGTILEPICNLIPGDKAAAAEFLNVAHTKIYKERKDYHDKMTFGGHAEL